MTSPTTYHNVEKWIEENSSSFLPPVCNKLMHGHGQMKVMFIGGPNIRRDFHINEGEELFYQIKGDMIVRVMEKGVQKDIKIKEGEVFLLPPRIPHSPQRFKDTVGLVLERHRLKSETDGLRYYCRSDQSKPLWERWFYCYDLGSQLGPVISEYFASKEHETDVPSSDNVTSPCPVNLDTSTTLSSPQSLSKLIEGHGDALTSSGKANLLPDGEFKMQVFSKSDNPHEFNSGEGQMWVWQHVGSSSALVNGAKTPIDVQGSLLIEPGNSWTLDVSEGGRTLVFSLDVPTEANPPKKQKDANETTTTTTSTST
eukprot:m.190843 g.190843  ORF g.190843 m.190843 type:complete len:312 (+) comp13643_c1_seq7:89-1024(+)